MRPPRRRGRPRQDRRDQLAVDLAVALREGEPSYAQRPDGVGVLSFRLPSTVKGRSDALQRKGQKPREIVVRAVVAPVLPLRHIITGCKRS